MQELPHVHGGGGVIFKFGRCLQNINLFTTQLRPCDIREKCGKGSFNQKILSNKIRTAGFVRYIIEIAAGIKKKNQSQLLC